MNMKKSPLIELLATALSYPMYILDEDCHVLWVNLSAEEFFGPSPIGEKCPSSFCGDRDRCHFCSVRRSVSEGEQCHHKITIAGMEGQRRNVLCTSRVVFVSEKGRTRGVVVSLSREITNGCHDTISIEDAYYSQVLYHLPGIIVHILDGRDFLPSTSSICSSPGNVPDYSSRGPTATSDPISEEIPKEDSGSMEKTHQDAQVKALRESEAKYRLLVENANEAIFVLQDGKIKYYNARAGEMGRQLGVNLDDFFTKYIHLDDRQMVIHRHQRRLKGENLQVNYSFRLVNSEGFSFWVNLNTVLIQWENRPATLNLMRDITSQKEMESRLLHTQKMEALGTLAGGIAHDFNNLLMAIQGNASLMALDIQGSHPHHEYLASIGECVKNGSELTRQLLGFAKGGKYVVKTSDMNELVQKSLQIFGRTKKEIGIHTRYQEDIWSVEVDRGQISQVLLNIFLNAWQAMPDGGQLFLETENLLIADGEPGFLELAPGRYVRTSVTDTGVGMDQETQERIFEPFFTTKKSGRGTGLGLASAYGIIKNHGGIIHVSSQEKKGSTFDIYLPATENVVVEENTQAETVHKGTETLLFVDDEEIILGIGVKILVKLGYKVFTAKNGMEAIDIYKSHKNKIDLVILDIIMPGMGGAETFERLKSINPDIKVLLSSGYSIADRAAEILSKGAKGFIQKPYRIKTLSKKIREIFETPGTTETKNVVAS